MNTLMLANAKQVVNGNPPMEKESELFTMAKALARVNGVILNCGMGQFDTHCKISRSIRKAMNDLEVCPNPYILDEPLFDEGQLAMYRDRVTRTIVQRLLEGGLI